MKDRFPFRLDGSEPLVLRRSPKLEPFFVLSPYVWKDADQGYAMLVRVVNRDDDPQKKVARVHRAASADGLDFTMPDEAVIPPGAPGDDDDGGCEDPTVVEEAGTYWVFYSGYSVGKGEATMLCASGPSLMALKKRGRVLPESDWYRNSKEATVVRGTDGQWRMFFEYSAEKASKIGLAAAPALDGPWAYQPFDFAARPDLWDAWHLSAGPIVAQSSGAPIMLYNGATQSAHWRIGWATFDPDFGQLRARGEEPLVEPSDIAGDATDIAFAASAVEREGDVWLYYSISDQRLMRAVLRLL
ncbi:MAG: hypothetical protein GIW94_10895 [Candidatus Eremiobacteraeota bacterium]|nr:hypothetical protein [Candidatus Eremiobacteraeota bacterium]